MDVNPAEISFGLPMRTVRFDLIDEGEVELLKGLNLSKIGLKGILYQNTRTGADDVSIQDTMESWQGMMRRSEPVRLIYTGKNWDLNMLCTIKNIEFHETGGCFDIEYAMQLHEWKSIDIRMAAAIKKRKNIAEENQTGKMYTVQQGDTLSHIAKNLLGDSSRWRELYELNQQTLKNPNLISVGQKLILPADASGTVPRRSHQTNSNKTTTSGKTTTKKKTNTKDKTSAPSKTQPSSQNKPRPSANNQYISAAEIFARYKKKR